MTAASHVTQRWLPLDSFEAPLRAKLQHSIRELISTHPLANIDHDPDWLELKANGRDRMSAIYLLVNDDDELIGYAPFFVHPSSFSFEYAARTFFTIRTRRIAITAQPLLAEGLDSTDLLSDLLVSMRDALGRSDVLFGLGVQMESPFARALLSPTVQARYSLMPHGPQYARRLVRLPDGLEPYLALLGSKSRADLRRHERRLAKAAQEDVSVTVHSSAESMSEFLRCAAEVSKLTYQWRMHRLGIDCDPETVQQFRAAADRGWLRCYLLLAKGKAIAFMIGHLYRGVYYSETIGYDPDWADYSVGNVLHMNVIRDLTALEPKVQWFDFMYGDNSNKERLSTDARQERNFYLVPRTIRWTLLLAALRSFDALTAWLNGMLERHGVKDKLKRWLRRRAVGAS